MVKLPENTATQGASDGGQKKVYDPIPNNTMLNVAVEECGLRELKEEFRAKYKIEDTHEINFKFRVLDGEYANRVMFASAKPYFNNSDNCRLRVWAEAILGKSLDPDSYEFDTDDLVGRHCQILVETKVKENGTTGNKVVQVVKSSNPQPAAAAAGNSDEYEPF